MGRLEQAMVTSGGAAGTVDTAGLAGAVVALLGGQPGGALGGLHALAAAFARAGLGATFESWVGAGANRPITPAALENALGAAAMDGFARSLGADPARVAAALAELLPRVVDQLTPRGVLPDGGGDPVALAARLLGR